LVVFRNLSPTANTQTTLSYSNENGKTQTDTQPYTISTFKINPTLSWFLFQKYRITSDLSAQYNHRTGSALLSFLPEKRNGSIYTWSLAAQYRINSFTSGSLSYSGKAYPKEEVLHEFKMEFRAEL
jgi:hypothetical protein